MTPENPHVPAISRPAAHDPCACGSGTAFADCCGPLLDGAPAPTAERLMRSRYTAHALKDYPYLHRTYLPTSTLPYTPGPTQVDGVTWTRLEIHQHEPGVRPNVSHVDFSAYFTEAGQSGVMHEKSEFLFRDGTWIFARVLRQGPAPVRTAAKVGRNDPCACGSGRKFKQCCGR